MKLHIVGNGYYGKFLSKILAPYADFTENAETVILAVPFSAYQEVAEKFRGKHLINICSIQEASNEICQKYSANVTGFHPLFGPKSSDKNRRGVLTLECPKSREILDLFKKVGTKIITEINNNALYSILGVDALQSLQLALNIIEGLLKDYNQDNEQQIIWIEKNFDLIK